MRVQTMAQPPPPSHAPPTAAGLGQSGEAKAVKGVEQTARPPPVANDRGGGEWLDARLPTGTVAFWAQLIGQKMQEAAPTTVQPPDISTYLEAYIPPPPLSSPIDEAVLGANLLDKPLKLDLYI